VASVENTLSPKNLYSACERTARGPYDVRGCAPCIILESAENINLHLE
jgi:hypothetical protein